MGMGKFPNLLLLLPGVMLDQFLALLLSRVPGQGTWLYFHHHFCLQRSHLGHESNPRCGPEPAAVPFLGLSMLCCVSGKDIKTPTGSIQQPAMGMTTLTKATSGSPWPGRMTEVQAYPLGLGMEATCRRRGDAFSRMSSSPRTCTSPGLSPARTPGLSVLFSLCSTTLSLHLGNVSRN